MDSISQLELQHDTIDNIIASIGKVFENRRIHEIGFKIVTLIKLLRSKLCPQSIGVSGVHEWDIKFADLLCTLFLPATPQPCWPRVIRQIVLEEFNHCDPYDGRQGVVQQISEQCPKLLNFVATLGHERELVIFCKDGGEFDNSIRQSRWRQFFSRSTLVHYRSNIPDGWTILHHAAWVGSPSLILTCLKLGVSLESVDAIGRDPLHVAASNGKDDAIKCLLMSGSSTNRIDQLGYTSFGLFLYSMSRCNWRQKMSPKSMVNCWQLFLTSDISGIWKHSQRSSMESNKIVSIDATNNNSSTNQISPEKCAQASSQYENHCFNLALNICADDSFLINAIVNLATDSSNNDLWDIHLIRFMLLNAVRRDKLNTIRILMENFHRVICPTREAVQYCSISDKSTTNSHEPDIVDYQIPSASMQFTRLLVVTAIVAGNLDSVLLLVRKFEPFISQFFASTNDTVEVEEVNGMDMSLICCHNVLAYSILSQKSTITQELLRSSFRANDEITLMPLSLFLKIEEATEASLLQLSAHVLSGIEKQTISRTKFSYLANSSIIQSISHLSPLSLACLLGDTESVHHILHRLNSQMTACSYKMSNACLNMDDNADLISTVVNYPQHPILCAVVTGNKQCLQLLAQHMDDDEFAIACSYNPGGVDALDLLLAILNYQLWSATTSPRDYLRNTTKNKFGNIVNRLDIVSNLYFDAENMISILKILIAAKARVFQIAQLNTDDANHRKLQESLQLVVESTSTPTIDSIAGRLKEWNHSSLLIDSELQYLNDRLLTLLPEGDLLSTSGTSADTSRLPISSSSTSSKSGYSSPMRASNKASSSSSKSPSSSVAKLVSLYTSMSDQVDKSPSSARKSPSKSSKGQLSSPYRRNDINLDDNDECKSMDNSTDKHDVAMPLGSCTYISSSTEDGKIQLKEEAARILINVRSYIGISDCRWHRIEERINDKVSFRTNFRLLTKVPHLDPNCWNKLAQIILTIFHSSSSSSNSTSAQHDSDGPTARLTISISNNNSTKPTVANTKPTEWWDKFIKLLTSHSNHVGNQSQFNRLESPSVRGRRNQATALAHTGIEDMADFLMKYSSPFGKNRPACTRDRLREYVPPYLFPKALFAELSKLFSEVNLSMSKDDYFDHLRSTKLKAGIYINPRILDALKLLYDWVCTVMTDASAIYDPSEQITLLTHGNTIIPGLENLDKTRLVSTCIQIVNIIDRQSYLQSVSKYCRLFADENNYSVDSYLSKLISPIPWKYEEQCRIVGEIASKAGIISYYFEKSEIENKSGFNSTSHEIQNITTNVSTAFLIANFALMQAKLLVQETIVTGKLTENAEISTYLGISMFTSVSKIHFRRLISLSNESSSRDDLVESVASQLIRKRHSIKLDVSKFDPYGRSALLSLCALKYWRAAKLLTETTLVDAHNNAIELACCCISNSKECNMVMEKYCFSDSISRRVEHLLQHRNIGTLAIINPLHFAILHNAVDFISFFMNSCPNIVVDISLFQFSMLVGTASISGLCLLSKCNAILADSPACLACPTSSVSTAFFSFRHEKCKYISKVDRAVHFATKMLHDLTHQQNIRRIQMLKWYKLSSEAIKNQSIDMSSVARITNADGSVKYMQIKPQLHGTLQGLCVVVVDGHEDHRKKSKPKQQSILLMNGTTVDYDILTQDVSLMSQAMPAPLFSCGTLSTNITILHHAFGIAVLSTLYSQPSSSSSSSSRSPLMLSKESGISPDFHVEFLDCLREFGCDRILCSDHNGKTPVFEAIQRGLYSDALLVLQWAIESVGTNSDLTTLNCLDSKFFKNVVVQNSGLSMHPYFYQVAVEQFRKCYIKAEAGLELKKEEFASTCPFSIHIGLLLAIQSRAESVWNHLCQCEFLKLLSVAYAPSGCVLDSVIRAKQVLALLGIPFSQIGVPFSAGNLPKKDDGKTGIDSSLRTQLFDDKLKYLQQITPEKIRKNISMATCLQLKDLLSNWFRLQSNFAISSSEASLFLFHRLDISILDIADNSLEILKRKIRPASSSASGRRSGAMTRGYLYINSCNDHMKDIGSQLGRQFVTTRILPKSAMLATRATIGATIGTGPPSSPRVSTNAFISQYNNLPRKLQVETQTAYSNLVKATSSMTLALSATSPSKQRMKLEAVINQESELTMRINGNKDVNAENIDDNAQLTLFMTKQMAAFFDYYAEHAANVEEALKLSYYILDLARLLVNCRLMTAMTQEELLEDEYDDELQSQQNKWSKIPAPSLTLDVSSPSYRRMDNANNRRLHPVELIANVKYRAQKDYSQACTMFGTDETADSRKQMALVAAEYGQGIQTRITIMDDLTAKRMEALFYGNKEFCGSSIISLRDVVLEGLATFLLAIGKPNLCEFVCKLTRKYSNKYEHNLNLADSHGISLLFNDDDQHFRSTIDATTHTNTMEDEIHGREKQLMIELIVFLQQIRIMNIFELSNSQACVEMKPQTRTTYINSLKQTNLALHTLLSDIFGFDLNKRFHPDSTRSQELKSAELIDLLVASRVSDIERQHALINPGVSPHSKQNAFNANHIERIRIELKHMVSTAVTLASFLRCIVGLIDHSQLYIHDIQLTLPFIETCNALTSLCTPRKIQILIQQMSSSSSDSCHSTAGLELTRSCWRSISELDKFYNLFSNDLCDKGEISSREQLVGNLLKFGVSLFPTVNAPNHSPICVAAVMGYDRLLHEMLSVEAARDIAFELPCFKYLIWYTLMSCAAPLPATKERTGISIESNVNASTIHNVNLHNNDRVSYLKTLKLLLEFGFPVEAPEQSHYNCADLSAMKRVASVYAIAIKKRNPTMLSKQNSQSNSELQTSEPSRFSHFVALHYSFLWDNIESSSFRDVAIVSTSRSRKCLFGSAPLQAIAPEIDEDIHCFVAFLNQQLSPVGLSTTAASSGISDSEIASSARGSIFYDCSSYFASRVKYSIATSLLNSVAGGRRDDTCPLWRSIQSSIVSLCPTIATASRICGDGSNIASQIAHIAPFPSSWTTFHIALACRNSRWFCYLVSALATKATSTNSSATSSSSSANGKPGDLKKCVEHGIMDGFRESISSLVLTACYYDDAVSLNRLVAFIEDDSTLQEKSVNLKASGSLLSPTATSEQSETNKLCLLINSDHFEPIGRQVSPMDVCALRHSSAALCQLVKHGVALSMDYLVNCVTSRKFDIGTITYLMQSFLVQSINKATDDEVVLQEQFPVTLLDVIEKGFDPLRVPATVSQELNHRGRSYGTTSSSKHRKQQHQHGHQPVMMDTGVLASGDTLLCFCCRQGLLPIVLLLLQAGADLSLTETRNELEPISPLRSAIVAGQGMITQAIAAWVKTRHRRLQAMAQEVEMGKLSTLTNKLSYQMEIKQIDEVLNYLSAVQVVEFHIRRYLLARHRLRRERKENTTGI